MSALKEFKDFIAQGNVVDLATAVVIGAAFGKIVTSFVNDVIMPPIGVLLGGADFSALKVVLKPADVANKVAAVSINYGTFINTIIQFVIVAAAIFFVVKMINNMKKKPPEAVPAPPAPTPTEALLAEIRDLMASRGASA